MVATDIYISNSSGYIYREMEHKIKLYVYHVSEHSQVSIKCPVDDNDVYHIYVRISHLSNTVTCFIRLLRVFHLILEFSP